MAVDDAVEVFDENGCSSISEPYTWITVGLTEQETGLDIYPVPFSDNLNIRATSPIRKITVFDAAGRMIFSNAPARNSMVLHSERWANGVYTLELTMEKNIIRKRVVKN